MDNVTLLLHSSAFIFDLIFFIPAGNKDNHKSLDEFDFKVEPTSDGGVNFAFLFNCMPVGRNSDSMTVPT